MELSNISKVLIQGITTHQGAYYAARLSEQGTPIVAGVSAGAQKKFLEDIPLYDLVEQATDSEGFLDVSLIFVESDQVLDAALEAISCGIKQLIIFSSGVPPLDMIKLLRIAKQTGTFILGSGSQGLLRPHQLCLGTHKYNYYLPGSVGIISRVDRLMDEVARILTQQKIGQSLSVCLGKDRVLGSSFEEWLQILDKDEQTKVILLLGRAYGQEEIRAAQYIKTEAKKPVMVYLAGLEVPLEKNTWSQFSSSLSDSSDLSITQTLWLESLTNIGESIVQHLGDIPTKIKALLKNC